MSSGEKQIVCRRCRESIPLTGDSCPHCGTSIRSNIAPIAALVFGLILAVAGALSPDELLFFALLGVALAAIGGYLLYDKRQRINEATGSDEGGVVGISDDTEQ